MAWRSRIASAARRWAWFEGPVAIYDWVHGISHHFREDLLPGFVGGPLVGAWRGIEWRPSISVERCGAPGDD